MVRSILIISTLVEPTPPKYYGGIEELVYFVLEYLVRKGWDVTLIDINLDERRDLNKLNTISRNPNFSLVKISAISSRINSIILVLRALLAVYNVIKTLRSKRVDIIHTYYFYPLFPLTMILKLITRIIGLKHVKIVFTTAAHYPWLARVVLLRSKLLYPFRKLMKSYADMVVTLSREMMHSIAYYLKLPLSKFKVIHDCYDDDEYDPHNDFVTYLKNKARELRRRLGLDDKLVVLYLARIEPVKGVDDLINAIQKVKQEIGSTIKERLKVIIAGKSSQEQLAKYKSIVKKLGLEGTINIIGTVPRSIVKILYLMADLYVLPTKLEAGPPISLLQAIGIGTPAITTKYALVPELSELKLAIVDEPFSDNLAKAFIKIINNKSILKYLWETEYSIVKPNYGKIYCGKAHERLYIELFRQNYESCVT